MSERGKSAIGQSTDDVRHMFYNQPHTPVTTFCGTGARGISLWQIISIIFATVRRPIQGVFCRSCADKKAIVASLTTWLLGWWGVPWGPIWSIYYLGKNLMGGEKPSDVNAALLGQQSLFLAQASMYQLAKATIRQALSYARSDNLKDTLIKIRQSLEKFDEENYELKDTWGIFKGMAFYFQIVPIVTITIFIVYSSSNGTVQSTGITHENQPHFYQTPPTIGSDYTIIPPKSSDKWYVTTDGLNIRQAPGSRERTIGEALPMFTTVTMLDDSNDQWKKVQVTDGRVGYVREKYIVRGDGEQARIVECNQKAGAPIQNGAILQQSIIGEHKIRIRNGLDKDAIVKLRSKLTGNILSIYVTANSESENNNIPTGLFDVLFATGTRYSRYCHRFMQDEMVQKFDNPANFAVSESGGYVYNTVIEFTIHRVVGGNASARPYDIGDFLKD